MDDAGWHAVFVCPTLKSVVLSFCFQFSRKYNILEVQGPIGSWLQVGSKLDDNLKYKIWKISWRYAISTYKGSVEFRLTVGFKILLHCWKEGKMCISPPRSPKGVKDEATTRVQQPKALVWQICICIHEVWSAFPFRLWERRSVGACPPPPAYLLKPDPACFQVLLDFEHCTLGEKLLNFM